jgi:hypothetical protein
LPKAARTDGGEEKEREREVPPEQRRQERIRPIGRGKTEKKEDWNSPRTYA